MTISIIGGGLMGVGIAQVFARAGYRVSIFEPIDRVRASIPERLNANLVLCGIDKLSGEVVTTDRLAESVDGATFITEAAPEKLDLKRQIFNDLIWTAPKDAILASNTSVIPITQIAGDLATAERIVGTHWWNPPYLVPLVEVIQGKHTSDATISTTMQLLSSIGKQPAYVKKDLPGFVANRLQHALWREAIAMVAEGVCDAQTLDHCVKNSFGLRLPVLGPLENADLVGLDLTLDIHRVMIPELDRHAGPHDYLKHKVEEGHLGFSTGEGFRTWTPEEMAQLRRRLVGHLLAAQREEEIR